MLCKEYLSDPCFYAAVILIFAVSFIGPSVVLSDKSYSIPAVLSDPVLYKTALEEIDCCSLIVALEFDSHTLFTILLPVIVSFPAIKIYILHKDVFQKQLLIRLNKRSYKAGIFLTAFLGGFIIAFIGVMLYVVVAFASFPPMSKFENTEFIEIYGGASVQAANLLKKLVNVCTVAGMFPIVTMIVYIAAHDKFFSLSFPMILQYISMKIYIVYSSWIYSDPERYENRILMFIGMLLPYEFTSHHSAWEYRLKLPFACFFAFAAVIIVILYIVFIRLTERTLGE